MKLTEMLVHEADTMLVHEADTTLVHEADTALIHEADTTLVHEADTTLVHEADTTLVHEADTALVHEADTMLIHEADTTLKIQEPAFLGWAGGPWGRDPFSTLDLCSGTPFLSLSGIHLYSLPLSQNRKPISSPLHTELFFTN